jgi:hypothetical protein
MNIKQILSGCAIFANDCILLQVILLCITSEIDMCHGYIK